MLFLQDEFLKEIIAYAIFKSNPKYKGCSDSLAFVAHPWSDDSTHGLLDDILDAQCNPARSLEHLDPREVAIDRLLRILEEIDFLSKSEISPTIELLRSRCLVEKKNLERHLDLFPFTQTELFTKDTTFIREIVSVNAFRKPSKQSSFNDDRKSLLTTLRNNERTANEDHTINPEKLSTIVYFLKLLLSSSISGKEECLGRLIGNNKVSLSIFDFISSFNLGRFLFQDHDAYISNLRAVNATSFHALQGRFGFPWEQKLPSYREIASRAKVTTEAARRASQRAARDFESLQYKKLDISETLDSCLLPIELLEKITYAFTTGSNNVKLVSKLFVHKEFDYSYKDGHATPSTLSGKLEEFNLRVIKEIDDNHLIHKDLLEELSEGLFFNEQVKHDYLKSIPFYYLPELGSSERCTFWSNKKSHEVRIIAALKILQKSSTKDEIGELSGLSAHQVSSKASSSPGVARADLKHWGFEEWIDDIYEGIVGEIEQRIDEHNGRVPLKVLLEEISFFGISEKSILTYSNADAYNVENGILKRNPARYKPKYPHSYTHSTFIKETGKTGFWGERIILHQRHFTGYSLHVNFDLAYANGLTPDTDITVPVLDNPNFYVSIIWRPTNPSRKIDVGRISDLLIKLEYKAGDEIILIPTPEHIQILTPETAISGEEGKKANLGGVHSVFGGGKDAG